MLEEEDEKEKLKNVVEKLKNAVKKLKNVVEKIKEKQKEGDNFKHALILAIIKI
mgnify:CR=1 FL=1